MDNLPIFTKYTFKEATNGDSEAVKDFVRSILSEFNLVYDSRTSEADLEDIEISYNSKGGVLRILTDDFGQVLGTIGYYPSTNERCKIRKMYLHPSLRGLGIGKKILDFTINEIEDKNFHFIFLETVNTMHAAISLYRSRGFITIDAKPESPRCDFVFQKKLK